MTFVGEIVQVSRLPEPVIQKIKDHGSWGGLTPFDIHSDIENWVGELAPQFIRNGLEGSVNVMHAMGNEHLESLSRSTALKWDSSYPGDNTFYAYWEEVLFRSDEMKFPDCYNPDYRKNHLHDIILTHIGRRVYDHDLGDIFLCTGDEILKSWPIMDFIIRPGSALFYTYCIMA